MPSGPMSHFLHERREAAGDRELFDAPQQLATFYAAKRRPKLRPVMRSDPMPEIELQERLNEILADVRDIRTMLLGMPPTRKEA